MGSKVPTIAVLLTLRCNQLCPHCFITQYPEKYGISGSAELTGKIWVKFFKELRSACLVNITGGEPTLHPDFLDIIYGIQPRHKQLLATNLTADITVYEAVMISGTALIASFHEHLSKDRKERFIHKARRLNCLGSLLVRYVTHLDGTDDAIEIAKQLCKASIRFQIVPIIDLDATGFRSINHCPLLTGQGKEYFIDTAYAAALEQAAGRVGRIDYSAIDMIVQHPECFIADSQYRVRCDIPMHHMVVNPAGDIFACRKKIV